MSKKRLLVAHPYITACGGGNVVAAWAIQALCDEFDVTVATLGGVDCAALNRTFGTRLREGDFTVRTAPWLYRWLPRMVPTQGALLEAALTVRWARKLERLQPFDVLLSTQNEADFGRPGLQYVHYPWVHLPRPEVEMRWFHRIPGFLSAYRGACQQLAGSTSEGLRRNTSLANSEFVSGKIREAHGTGSVILYPPVPGEFPETPWDRRRVAAVAIGRMHPIKRWEMAVEIVERVRQSGSDVGLTLIAHSNDPEYGAQIRALAATRPWFRILQDLPRPDLAAEVSTHRYGLHAMEFEHFGIAVAELQRAGCLPFVHNSGGPVEIVGGRRELLFDDPAEGAEKMLAVLRNASLEIELREFADKRRELFSAERFCEHLNRLVHDFPE